MSTSQRRSPFKYRGYWLGQIQASPCWYVFGPGRRRISLGTRDVREASDRLVDWVLENGELDPGDPRSVTVAAVLQRYWHKHAKALPSAEQARIAANQTLEFFKAAPVSDLTPQRQEAFRAWLGSSRKPGTVSRALSVLRSALNWSVKHQELTAAPFIFDVKKAPPGERILSTAELAALHDGFDCDYARVYFWLVLGTAGRKTALLELTRFQCDIPNKLIWLNPEGRAQTAKRRATVPMASFLVPIVEACRAGHLVHLHGRPLDDIKAPFRRARTNAGLGADVTTTALRRTVATWLRKRNVPEGECAAWMGHRWSNSTTERYATWRPDHLSNAAHAVDELLRAVAGEIEARAHRRTAGAVSSHPGGR